MRPPGGFTTDMFNYACDIDIYRVWAQLLVHGQGHLIHSNIIAAMPVAKTAGPTAIHTTKS